MRDDATCLVVAIVQSEDAAALSDALVDAGLPGPTRLSSSGGFLRQANVTLLLAVPAERVAAVLRLMSEHCHARVQYINPLPPILQSSMAGTVFPMEVQVGGATVFILEVERYERL